MSRRFLLATLVTSLAAGSAATGVAQQRYDPAFEAGRPYDIATADDATRWSDWQDLPAFVSFVEGYVELDRFGQTSRDIENVPLEAGDRLGTTRGRAELLFDDGSTLALDEHTTVTILSADEIDLAVGRVRLQWRGRGTAADPVITTAAGRVILRTAGDYRITLGASRLGDAEVEVAVSRGSAELANALGRTIVREGTRALTTAAYAPSIPYAFARPNDDFQYWTDDLERDRYGYESARYLPTSLRYYGGVFDRYGSWRHHTNYGWVWYPRVSLGWRPYDGGRWSFVIGFGYSWVGGSRWAWPTHHYGRWDCVGTTWFWVPSAPPRTRAVGYAVPRSSYAAPVTYYTRPANLAPARPITTRGGTAVPRRDAQTAPANRRPVATPRSAPATTNGGRSGSPTLGPPPQRATQPAIRRAPSVTTPGRPDTPTRATPRTAPPTSATRPAPSRSATAPQRSSPAPRVERSAPQRTAPAPQTERPAPQRASPAPRAERPAPQRFTPTPRAERPAPQRSTAPARTAPPRTSSPPRTSAPPAGSRTPSRSGGTSSGSARRRGGGG